MRKIPLTGKHICNHLNAAAHQSKAAKVTCRVLLPTQELSKTRSQKTPSSKPYIDNLAPSASGERCASCSFHPASIAYYCFAAIPLRVDSWLIFAHRSSQPWGGWHWACPLLHFTAEETKNFPEGRGISAVFPEKASASLCHVRITKRETVPDWRRREQSGRIGKEVLGAPN